MRLRSFAAIMGAVFICCLSLVPAFAQSTLLPMNFQPNEHVLVGNSWTTPIDKQSLTQRLNQADQPQHLSTYVVFTYRGNENDSAAIFGTARVNELYKSWSPQNMFPVHNHVLLMIVRNNTNPNQYAIGLKVAPDVTKYISQPELDAAINDHKPTLISGQAENYVIEVVNDLSADIARNYARDVQARSAETAQTVQTARPVQPYVVPQISREEAVRVAPEVQSAPAVVATSHGHGFLFYLFWLLVIVAICRLVEFIYLRMNAGSWKKKIGEPLANAQQLKQKLDTAYLGLLTRTDSTLVEGGQSGADVLEARKAWAAFSVKLSALADRMRSVDKISGRTIPVLWNEPLRRALKAMTTIPIVITGDELPRAELDVMKGLVAKEEITPWDLVGQLQALFSKARDLAEAEDKADKEAMANTKAIVEGLARVVGEIKQLADAGVNTEPLAATVAALNTRVDDLKKELAGDPKSAAPHSQALKDELATFEAHLQDAIALETGGLATIDSSLAHMEEAILQTRQSLPMTEPGGNPSTHIDEAKRLIALMKGNLLAGKIGEGEENRDQVLVAIDAAHTLLEAVVAAKTAVETNPSKVEEVSDQAEADAVAAAYKDGRYIAAKQGLDALKTKQANRRAAGDRLGECKTLAQTLTADATQNSQYTSATTDGAVATASTALNELDPKFTEANPNWTELAESAVHVKQQLVDADAAIKADVTAHNQALTEIESLATQLPAIGAALQARISSNARSKLALAPASISQLEQAIQGHKQDWKTLFSQAEALSEQVRDGLSLAQTDIQNAAAYEAELNSTRRLIMGYAGQPYYRTIRGVQYGANVRYDGGLALAHLSEAESGFNDCNWAIVQQELAEARREATFATYAAGWLVLEEMNRSQDDWARQYAYQAGYSDGRFDSWRDQRVPSSVDWTAGDTGGGAAWTDHTWSAPDDTSWHPSTPTNGNSGFDTTGGAAAGTGNSGFDQGTPVPAPTTGNSGFGQGGGAPDGTGNSGFDQGGSVSTRPTAAPTTGNSGFDQEPAAPAPTGGNSGFDQDPPAPDRKDDTWSPAPEAPAAPDTPAAPDSPSGTDASSGF
jgi:hypothetical protein